MHSAPALMAAFVEATEALISAIRNNDAAQLTRIPGVGRKTAERMALELRDKLDAFAPSAAGATPVSGTEQDVVSALVNLGYQRGIAEKAVTACKNGSEGFDVLFRKALTRITYIRVHPGRAFAAKAHENATWPTERRRA